MLEKRWHAETNTSIIEQEPKVGTENVYLTTEYGAYAVDATDGTTRWDYRSTDVIRQKLLFDGETVYLLLRRTDLTDPEDSATGELYALNAKTGTERWTFERETQNEDDTLFEPVIHGDHLYLCGRATESGWQDYKLYVPTTAFGQTARGVDRPLSGDIRDGSPATAPCVTDEVICVGTEGDQGWVEFFAPLTADVSLEEWGRYELPDGGAPRTMCWQNDTLYVGTDDNIYAVTKILQPELPAAEWTVAVPDSVHTFRTIDHTLIAGMDEGLVAVDLNEGQVDWQVGGGEVRDLVVTDGTVYATRKGSMIAVHAANGSVEWTFDTNERGFRCAQTVDDGIIYAAAGSCVYAIDATDGAELASTEMSSRDYRYPAPVVAGEVVYVGCGDGLYALSAADRTDSSGSVEGHSQQSTSCPECGTELDGDETFCPSCGEELTSTGSSCPGCGANLEGEEAFCPECGYALSE